MLAYLSSFFALTMTAVAVSCFTLATLVASGKFFQKLEIQRLNLVIEYSQYPLLVWSFVCGAILSGTGIFLFTKAMTINASAAVTAMIVFGTLGGLAIAQMDGVNVLTRPIMLIVVCIIFLGLLLETELSKEKSNQSPPDLVVHISPAE